MKRRTRLIAGILAFVAMTFSFAGTAWASTCASMEMEAVSSEAEDMAGHDGMRGASHEGEREGSGDEERPCPFSPAAAQACAGVAALPSHATDGLAPSPGAVSDAFFEATHGDLLLHEPLFHPPRA